MAGKVKDVLGGKSVGELLAEGFEELAVELKGNRKKIAEKFTCRRMSLDLHPQSYSPRQVKETRGLLNASQTVFAQFLGVSPQTVRAWEQGVNTPQASACRLMDEIRHDPEYWQERIRTLAVVKSEKKRVKSRV